MAMNKGPSAPAEGEQSEREYQATLNRAVEDTEREIFADALGEDELDNDADTTLEDMGDGLEGEDTEEDAGEESEVESERDDRDEDPDEPDDPRENDEEDERDGPDRDQPSRFREPAVPSGRLREQTERAARAEERAIALERQNAEIMGRLAEISARVNAPQPRQQAESAPKPNMFEEPEKYEQWLLAEAERKAEARAAVRYAEFEQRQQATFAQRVDNNLAEAARGDRGFEFGPAYNALTALDPRDQKARATVASIYNAPDPGKALFDWWDRNGGEEYRDRVYQQLAPRDDRGQRGGRRGEAHESQQPRHVIRPAQRVPSLNSARGSNVQRTADPEMYDGSEASIFRYGTRP